MTNEQYIKWRIEKLESNIQEIADLPGFYGYKPDKFTKSHIRTIVKEGLPDGADDALDLAFMLGMHHGIVYQKERQIKNAPE